MKNAVKTSSPRSVLLKCNSSNGITSSLRKGTAPLSRSGQATSAHNMPPRASTTSAIGKTATGIAPTCLSDPPSNVNATAITHKVTRIEVADVDHGSETATAAAT